MIVGGDAVRGFSSLLRCNLEQFVQAVNGHVFFIFDKTIHWLHITIDCLHISVLAIDCSHGMKSR